MGAKLRLICYAILCITICVAVACDKDNTVSDKNNDTVIDSIHPEGQEGDCVDAPKERFVLCDSSAHIDWKNYNPNGLSSYCDEYVPLIFSVNIDSIARGQ